MSFPKVLIAYYSMFSITKLAMIGDRLEPIGIPLIYLKILSCAAKYVLFKQRVMPSIIKLIFATYYYSRTCRTH